MATDRAFLRRRRIFGAKVETDTGTAITLAAADCGFNAFDRDIQHNIEQNEREQQGSLSMLTSVPGKRQGTITVRTHLHGSGGSDLPLWATTLLAGSGFAATGSAYAPSTVSATTLTSALYEDGRFHPIAGAKADWTWTFRAGNPVDAEWRVTGKMLEPTAVALVEPTYPTVKPPRFASATLTVGGTAYKVNELSITPGNQIVVREDPNADDDSTRTNDGTGIHAFAITGRQWRISMDPEAVAFGSKNWYQDCLDADTMALSIVLGSAANNTITIACPALQVVDPQPGDRNGIMVDQLTLMPRADSDAGDDELTVTFS